METQGSTVSGTRRRWTGRLAAAPVAALLLAGCVVAEERADDPGPAEASPGEMREVPLRVVEQDGRTLAFVPVTIAGEGSFLFALDTGASVSVVHEDVADEVGLELTGERRAVSGVIATGEVPVGEVEEWKVGDVPLQPGEVTVIDLGTAAEGSGGIQGLLGSDVLSGFGSITVDYDNGVLRLPAP
ncbi:retropepsin-like aspartic protease [Streptomyces sp. 549]|uniref:retropepsin-like aspartic protease n=1 Tax=Streptomyces sp. 549 TaxID=3049076 RepID=UPI0024C39574|nr:retropepsin-like aspartic protease [Streptomyces sp. 549]MDK1474796.1 retropepsin-like aspartic protease [Streptomyces sp. 549]